MTGPGETGTLLLIVGPSGVGKDSLIDGLRERLDDARFEFAQRVITRPVDAGGEAHEACTPDAFAQRESQGDFLISWRAHGLAYGLKSSIRETLAQGRHVIANGSRGAVETLSRRVQRLTVIEINAPAEMLAARLASRAREPAEGLERRLARAHAEFSYPQGVTVLRVMNDSRLDIGIARLEATVRRHLGLASQTASGPVLSKIAGQRIDASGFATALSDIVVGKLSGAMRDAFLTACASDLDDEEIVAVARWRSTLMPRVQWDAPIVVDKHSLGGTAGSRVTMVVIPIVAAHGLTIPKTSSRAITSASGTADAMEVLARVDLDPEALRRCVASARACIAWNGRLNHSLLDETMHRIERELKLDTRRWSVASILSKKWSAGATHVVIDIPYAPKGKVHSREAAGALAQVFETVGAQLGLTVRAFSTDASAPIGRGIGPALEARDAMQILENHPQAPEDLRQKSLFFASQIIALDPQLKGDLAAAERRALELLESGRAHAAMQAIIEAQGRRLAPDPSGLHEETVRSNRSGNIARVRAQAISAIARAAGAPADLLAGVDLLARPGDHIDRGAPLFRLQGRDPQAVARALDLTGIDSGFDWCE
jgi:thymidine phosphorylase